MCETNAQEGTASFVSIPNAFVSYRKNSGIGGVIFTSPQRRAG